jgi:tripartite-type tricarboxylate transporter receptor subunit TctC
VAAGGMTDLMAGRIDATFDATGSLLQLVRSDQVRRLGITPGRRFKTAPELPTMAETGYGSAMTSWYGI